jgi:hypothetical protein
MIDAIAPTPPRTLSPIARMPARKRCMFAANRLRKVSYSGESNMSTTVQIASR